MTSRAGSCVGPQKRRGLLGLAWRFLLKLPRSNRLILLLGPLGHRAPSSLADLGWREVKCVAKTRDLGFLSQLFFRKTIGPGRTAG